MNTVAPTRCFQASLPLSFTLFARSAESLLLGLTSHCDGALETCVGMQVKMDAALQRFLHPDENPLTGANAFKKQVFQSKLGLS